jgi:hypothetical protein
MYSSQTECGIGRDCLAMIYLISLPRLLCDGNFDEEGFGVLAGLAVSAES